jgi:UDP-glucose 4-epimerase
MARVPEEDCEATRQAYDDQNVKANEYLYRRVDLEDVVSAHLRALERAPSIGFGRYIITATTPFLPDDLSGLRLNAPLVVQRRVPEYEAEYARRGWKMFPGIEECTSMIERGKIWAGAPYTSSATCSTA